MDDEELLDVTDDSDLQNIDDVAPEEGADILEDEEPAPELDAGNIEDDLPPEEMPVEEDIEEEIVEVKVFFCSFYKVMIYHSQDVKSLIEILYYVLRNRHISSFFFSFEN